MKYITYAKLEGNALQTPSWWQKNPPKNKQFVTYFFIIFIAHIVLPVPFRFKISAKTMALYFSDNKYNTQTCGLDIIAVPVNADNSFLSRILRRRDNYLYRQQKFSIHRSTTVIPSHFVIPMLRPSVRKVRLNLTFASPGEQVSTGDVWLTLIRMTLSVIVCVGTKSE